MLGIVNFNSLNMKYNDHMIKKISKTKKIMSGAKDVLLTWESQDKKRFQESVRRDDKESRRKQALSEQSAKKVFVWKHKH